MPVIKSKDDKAVPYLNTNTLYQDVTPTLSAPAAYAANDFVGTTGSPMAFPKMAAYKGGIVRIVGVQIFSKAVVTGNLELWLFNKTITTPTDNAAWAISDADGAFIVGVLELTKVFPNANNSVYELNTIDVRVATDAADDGLFGALVTRGTPTFANGDLTIRIYYEQE